MYKISFQSTSRKSLDLYILFIKTIFRKLNISYSLFDLPQTLKRFALLKSPHVHKKAKEHFELRKYKVIVNVKHDDTNLIKFLILNKPKSINANLLSTFLSAKKLYSSNN